VHFLRQANGKVFVMPDVTVFSPNARGYSVHDCTLEDLLFGIALDDETPEGPTRTWIYREGAADEVGRFEPISADPDIERRPEAIALTRMEPPQAPKPRWERRSAREASEDFWVVQRF
jgi:hypothetical protein